MPTKVGYEFGGWGGVGGGFNSISLRSLRLRFKFTSISHRAHKNKL